MKLFRNILIIVMMVLIFVLTIQNQETLSTELSFRFDLIWQQFSTGALPLYAVLLVTFFTGLLLSWGLAWAKYFRLKSRYGRLHNLLEEKEKELNSLRNLPVLEGQDEGDEASAVEKAVEGV